MRYARSCNAISNIAYMNELANPLRIIVEAAEQAKQQFWRCICPSTLPSYKFTPWFLQQILQYLDKQAYKYVLSANKASVTLFFY